MLTKDWVCNVIRVYWACGCEHTACLKCPPLTLVAQAAGSSWVSCIQALSPEPSFNLNTRANRGKKRMEHPQNKRGMPCKLAPIPFGVLVKTAWDGGEALKFALRTGAPPFPGGSGPHAGCTRMRVQHLNGSSWMVQDLQDL